MIQTIAKTLIYTAGLLWAIEGVPQIIKLIKTKETKGISIFLFVICLIAYTMFIIGNIILKNYSVVVSQLLPFSMVSIILCLIIKYSERRK